jgi:hypothetical protein
METKRALRAYSGKREMDNEFSFMNKEKVARFEKISRDKKEKVHRRARDRKNKPAEKDIILLAKELQRVSDVKEIKVESLFSLLQRTRDVESLHPSDRGVRALRILLDKKWSNDKTAELEGKDLADVRSYYNRIYPGSYVTELLSVDPMHKGTADYGQTDPEVDPMHTRIYMKVAVYPEGRSTPIELPAGSLIKVCEDMELTEGGKFDNPVVIEADGKVCVIEKDVLVQASKRILSPEKVAIKIAELLIKYPRAKNQLDIVASDESGFDVELIRRAQKFGLNNDTKMFMAAWDNFKKADALEETITSIVEDAKEQIGDAVKDKVDEIMSVDEVPEEDIAPVEEGEDTPPDASGDMEEYEEENESPPEEAPEDVQVEKEVEAEEETEEETQEMIDEELGEELIEEEVPEEEEEIEASKKKASAYTDFIKKYMKEHEGADMGAAAKAWKAEGGGGDDKDEDKKEDSEEGKESKRKSRKNKWARKSWREKIAGKKIAISSEQMFNDLKDYYQLHGANSKDEYQRKLQTLRDETAVKYETSPDFQPGGRRDQYSNLDKYLEILKNMSEEEFFLGNKNL